jgi:hypothetical protein
MLSDREREKAAQVLRSHGYAGTIRLARQTSDDECAFLFSADALATLPVAAVTAALIQTLGRKVYIANDTPPWSDGSEVLRLADQDQPPLTLDEAYRATYHFIAQYYGRERTTRLFLMLVSMDLEPGDDPRRTSDPVTWEDWLASVEAARASSDLPALPPPLDGH